MNNLNLIVGTDDNLVNFYLHDILKNINYVDDNKIIYDLSNQDFSLILDEASMISLFSNVKVIIGNNFDLSKLNEEDINYLDSYVNNQNNDVYIVLLASKIDARLKNYKLFKDNFKIIDTTKSSNDDDIYLYVKNALIEKKYKMSDSDITYFISKVGNDINNIQSELDKLCIYKEQDKTITLNDIDLLISDSIDNIIYEFTNAFLEKDINKLTKMYNDFKISNMGADYLIASLSNTLRQALIIKILNTDNKSNLEISKIIGKKEFYVKKMLERLYIYSLDDICSLITSLADIDNKLKNGEANIDLLELYILKNN